MRKYNEPLTDEILERMHTAKSAKIWQEKIKKKPKQKQNFALKRIGKGDATFKA